MLKRCISTINISQYVKLYESKTAGVIQLNRPKTLNAINMEMFETIHRLLVQLEGEKDIVLFKGSGNIFCAGGDIKQILNVPEVDFIAGYTNGYRSVNVIANYNKPFIALMDGLTMGAGTNYCVPGKYSVATERTVFALPETSLGYYATVTYFLPRLKHNFGIYMGLTGSQVKGFDVKKIGLATNYVESDKLNKLESVLMSCKTNEDVDRVLEMFSSDPISNATRLDEFLPKIEKCFAGETVEKIYDNLREDDSNWANETIKVLNRMSPISLKVVHRSLLKAKTLSLQDCLQMEYRLAIHYNMKSDFREGARALIFDKDFAPNWSHKSIYDVTEEEVARHFQPLYGKDELSL